MLRRTIRARPSSSRSLSVLSPSSAAQSGRRGLYAPETEKDSCGVALLAHLKGVPSHSIVQNATIALARMEHRGGCGCETNTGDGAGILLGMPHEFMKMTAAEVGIANLPDPGQYASGLLFLSNDEQARQAQMKALEVVASRLNLKVLGWRRPPVDGSGLGKAALASEPHIMQCFVGKTEAFPAHVDMERHLVLLRKLTQTELHRPADFYIASLSSRTITYKGQLTPAQLPEYYLDLTHPKMKSHMAMVHSRFSTNTFPSWDRAQPNRMLCHNGEINTLRGNKNWIASRMASMQVPYLAEQPFAAQGLNTQDLAPFTSDDKTDSGNLDSILELLVKGSENRTLPEAMMMMVPEAWQSTSRTNADQAKRAFYEYHSCVQEPWDGPAMMAFTDGKQLGAVLDRNGLRPSRFYVTKQDVVILSSEVGVVPDLDPAEIMQKGRLEPGKMFLVDFARGGIVHDQELKQAVASKRPYAKWLEDKLVRLEDWKAPAAANNNLDLNKALHTFGYKTETVDLLVQPMANTGKEALGSMGVDTPLAVLSSLPQLPFNYMKQLFAQVTNPPIDPIREEIVMSLECPIGPESNMFVEPTAEHCQRLWISHPVLADEAMHAVQTSQFHSFHSSTIPCFFEQGSGGKGMEDAIAQVCLAAEEQAKKSPLLVLSQANGKAGQVPIPSLLVTGAVHHHLIKKGLRTKVGLLVQAGDAREVHDYCCLVGFGADAVHPFVANQLVRDLYTQNKLPDVKDVDQALYNYRAAAGKGMLKVMAKMGISTLQSYKGAQIFECVGLDDQVCDTCFPGTVSRIGGANFDSLAADSEKFFTNSLRGGALKNFGEYHYRDDASEAHYNSPLGMSELQIAARSNSSAAYKKYSQDAVEQSRKVSIRGQLELDVNNGSVDLSQVEPASEIVKRFCTGAMSFGSISLEAHEALAVAMNRLGGKSNTGEGGEDENRFVWRGESGESKRSAIKQVASGRFGVTSNYLANADQIQIKMAQGAKPGEGGELPGFKVSKDIAKTRGTTPGVGLISPPPHHDIYSIEDLAQLIHDLKNSNPVSQVSVKLVSEVGVGVVAAGCVKAKADHLTISGGDGGTGAAAWTGVHKCGIPWELGLAETQHTLVLNDLRSRVTVQADGQMKTGRDVVIAALLGAEEVAFATAPLIAMGCIMMRKCHLNTCPVGIATQDPVLRAKFSGKPEHVVNYLFFLAEEVREYMAALGFKTWNEMVGRSDRLKVRDQVAGNKNLDLSHLLFPSARLNEAAGVYRTKGQDHQLNLALDNLLIDKARPVLDGQMDRVVMEFDVNNLNRTVGTMLSYEISKRFGSRGLALDDTVLIRLNGHCGQSLGFALAHGVTIDLSGDANDFVGKSLSGGKIIIRPPPQSPFVAEDNILLGNVALYGATSGEAYFRGIAGERFCVRNSGAQAVVEGAGDHACEYMTGGRVVILGRTGRNFGAGMSGGIAYVLEQQPGEAGREEFASLCNMEMIDLLRVQPGSKEDDELRGMVERHLRNTDSAVAFNLLEQWSNNVGRFIKVLPKDYARVLLAEEKAAT
ncbi:hypothetical protein BASA81_003277 [Batrachochytrium salamandrivorans]|nr:hypothetical protein BASA81_003277 [Batrachochytrium salamandrivorans]